MQCFNALMHFLLAEQPSLLPASVSAATILQIILPVPLESAVYFTPRKDNYQSAVFPYSVNLTQHYQY